VAVAVEKRREGVQDPGRPVVEDSPDLQGLDPRKDPECALAVERRHAGEEFSEEKRALMDPGLLKAAEAGAKSRPGRRGDGDPPAPAARHDP